MEGIDVTLMRDGFLRDTVHPLENTAFGEALDAAVFNAVVKTIYETPALKEVADNLRTDLELGDREMVELDIKEAFYTISRMPDKKTFYNALQQNIQHEIGELYKAVAEGAAQEIGVGDAAALFTLSKAERNRAFSQLQEVHFEYGGQEYTLTPKEAWEVLNLNKAYIKVDLGVRDAPSRIEMLVAEEFFRNFAETPNDKITV